MGCFSWFCFIVVLLWVLIYFGAPLSLGTAAVGLLLFVWTYVSDSSFVLFIPLWMLFFAIAVPLNIRSLRKSWITENIYAMFKEILPSMSATEREALEAGSVWWDGDLFSGDPDWNKLLSYPKPTLTDEEQAFLDGPTEELCKMLDDWKITSELHDLPEEVWQFIKDKGFFGMIIPKKYGGLGFSALGHSAVVVKITSRSMAAGVTIMVPNSLGPAELILHYGTDEQKEKYLAALACGKEVPCFALTSPEAGSDAASMPDTGIVTKENFEGEETLGIRATFDKRYITLSPVSTVIALAFHLYDPEKLLGDKEDIGITVALLPSDTPGVETRDRHNPLGVAFMNGPVRGKDIFIPVDWIVGGKDGAGKGWKMLMERLGVGRGISLPSVSVASGKLACRATGAYARVRKQFKMSVGRFEGIEEKLATIGGCTYRMDAARMMTVGAIDQGEAPSVISAIVKYNLTEDMRRVVIDSMDIHAGSGISFGPRNIMGLNYTALPIGITVEGANILTRTLIVFGQGAIRCHPYVLKEMESVRDDSYVRGLDNFDKAFFGHIGFTLKNSARSLFMALTGARFAVAPAGPTKRYYQKLARFSASFALIADMAMMTLGSALKKKERLSGRLADALSHLYLASTTLKRFEDDGRIKDDLPFVKWACEDSIYTIQKSLAEVIDNLPVRPAAWLLTALIFPLGKREKKPADHLGHKIASALLTPSDLRDRLTDGMFVHSDVHDPVGRVEDAFLKVVKAETAEKALATAIKTGAVTAKTVEAQIESAVSANIITKEEADDIKAAISARRDVITVDDFPPSYWRKDGGNQGSA
ncbi:Acyl-CoA dehydrogenase [hydrothermal vent metagenome]|uniref:Acyl-coenzyme A dehydrogenase n=1 Tax=hydrothermal vent metagenome TaxID=652676 RepID=A0A3B1C5H4_9ZZZZ